MPADAQAGITVSTLADAGPCSVCVGDSSRTRSAGSTRAQALALTALTNLRAAAPGAPRDSAAPGHDAASTRRGRGPAGYRRVIRGRSLSTRPPSRSSAARPKVSADKGGGPGRVRMRPTAASAGREPTAQPGTARPAHMTRI
jgi:hypothetical protein